MFKKDERELTIERQVVLMVVQKLAIAYHYLGDPS